MKDKPRAILKTCSDCPGFKSFARETSNRSEWEKVSKSDVYIKNEYSHLPIALLKCKQLRKCLQIILHLICKNIVIHVYCKLSMYGANIRYPFPKHVMVVGIYLQWLVSWLLSGVVALLSGRCWGFVFSTFGQNRKL